jgi:hypothetical protein
VTVASPCRAPRTQSCLQCRERQGGLGTCRGPQTQSCLQCRERQGGSGTHLTVIKKWLTLGG